MQKKWKKIIFAMIAALLLFLTLPAIVEWRESEDMKILEKVIDNI